MGKFDMNCQNRSEGNKRPIFVIKHAGKAVDLSNSNLMAKQRLNDLKWA